MPEPTTRRDFLTRTCPALAVLALGTSTLAGCDSGGAMDDPPDDDPGTGISVNGNTVTLDLTGTQAGRLMNQNGFLFISSAKVVAVNVDGTNIRAFTSICTHQGCDINSFQNGAMRCPCHGSSFDTRGEVVTGPATLALTEYTVARTGNTVTITKS